MKKRTPIRRDSRWLCFRITNLIARLCCSLFRWLCFSVIPNRRGLIRSGRFFHRGRRPAFSRAGVSLVELVIACLLIGSVAGLVLPTVTWTAVQRRAAHQRQAASEELANLMDRLTREAWENVTDQRAQELGLAEEIERQLPNAQLSATMDADQDAKRVHLSLSWSDRAGHTVAPVRLTTWVYRQPITDQNSGQEGDSR